MRKKVNGSMRAALFVALCAAVYAPAADAKSPARSSRLKSRESLRQTFDARPGRREDGKPIRERRRLRATLTAALPFDVAAIDADTLIGLRIGAWKFERRISSDVKWRPGKTHATFHANSDDPSFDGTTTIHANWSGATLRVTVVSTCLAPIAAAGVASAEAGRVTSSIDGAVRFGDAYAHLGGTATGDVALKSVRTNGPTLDLARVELAGSADVVGAADDTRAPVVTVSSPAPRSYCPTGGIVVEGAVRDDLSAPKITWSIDGGSAADAPVVVDPESGILDDVSGTYSFVLNTTPGEHTLLVVATDEAGNQSTTTVEFTVRVPPPIDEPPPPPVVGDPVPNPVADPAPETDAAYLHMSKWGATFVDAAGGVQAWGYNTTTPTSDAGVAGVQTAQGDLALLSDGTVTTLRGDPSGTSTSSAPTPITDLTDVVDIAQCSTNSASFAVKSDGTVWAWGDDSAGQMGDGGGTSKYPPVQVPGLPAIKAVSAGGWHAIALDQQGGVWTWGGRSAPTAGRAPRQIAGVANAVKISASQFDRYATGAAIVADGSVWMWGDGLSGQLGSTVTLREAPAFQVAGVSDARAIAMGYNHVLVALGDGSVIARGNTTSEVWGYWGELGDGGSSPRFEFQPVPGLANVVQVAAGAHTSSALLEDGTAAAWGQNTYGSLGDGTTTDRPSPVVVLLSK
jgi:hypothetical protein